MAANGVTLTGDKELGRLLSKLPEKVQSRVLKKATGFAAKRPLKEYKAKVKSAGIKFPAKAIGTKAKTYRKSGNTVVVVGAKRGFFIGKPTKKEPEGQPLGKVLNVMEYGWKQRGNRAPRPMLRQVYYAAKQYILGEFQKGIGNGIEKEAAKLAKSK